VSAALAIPVLRCSAAGIPLGLAAEDVAEFTASAAEATAPSLAALLGLVASPGPGSERTLRLRTATSSTAIRVEGPVRIRPVTGSELLPVPRLLTSAGMAPVIGFLEEGGQVVLLLDVAGLVRLAEQAVGHEPAAHDGSTPW
jgi:hypothetical protein